MIEPEYVRTMAQYNDWQNRAMVAAADTLDQTARTADRGAFFGSIARTCSHLLWADLVWMARLAGWDAPRAGLAGSPALIRKWDEFRTRRRVTDARILEWSESLEESDLEGAVSWYSGVAGADVTRSRWLLIVHMFNHQTHHRGQIHAMLTSAGAATEPTDLFMMLQAPQPTY
ncbi:DinB family protein [Roseitranquillus sediminis]|uniref:DinB family protein n=1 Tax=Roseitranquillus sediminis TaxID=2809051 RepID=UPI001D0C68AE|nr:DinB family protein [Roseitranquillus sediminis]MBM9595846.1 DinB family protein [Roseitranquillus sediminis]